MAWDHCALRTDDSGAWNTFKAWHPFLIHMVACSLLYIVVAGWVNDRDFKTGSPPSLLTSGLYQTQITGLISLALIIIRLLAGSCSTLLIWRTIFILLEYTRISLTELLRLCNYRFPIVPQVGPGDQLLWSCWAVTVIILLWPPGFAAPLASSSVAWTPSTRISDKVISVPMPAWDQFVDWEDISNSADRTATIVNAALMASKDPGYAFKSDEHPLRRYFKSAHKIPTNSRANLTLPYFDVSLRWIDAASNNKSRNAGLPRYSDLTENSFEQRSDGSVAVIRNNPWKAAIAKLPAAEVYRETKLISIKVNTLRIDDQLPDGSHPNRESPCPTISAKFGKLPGVGQQAMPFLRTGSDDTWASNDCYLIAEATITAGKYKGTDCEVFPTNDIDHMATCLGKPPTDTVEADWISALALDIVSETMKYITIFNFTRQYMHNKLDEYTTGMLKLGYHAAWSSTMHFLANVTGRSTVRVAEPVVLATVDRTKLGIWLAMNATLTISAILVAVARYFSTTKTVRDTTLAALTMDLTEVMHDGQASGLCNAVAFSKEDHKLPKLEWADDCNRGGSRTYCHRVVFARSDDQTS